jgi:hypothetical protein
LVRTELASSQTTIDLGGIDFAGSAQGDAVRTIQRRGSAPDPCPVRRKGVHARNLIGDEDDPAVAFAEAWAGRARAVPRAIGRLG